MTQEIRKLGGDPTEEIWLWLLNTGPHGLSFTWSQTRQQPSGYIGLQHLQEIVQERSSSDASFLERARHAAGIAMASKLPELIRRGLQIAAVVGGDAELDRARQLSASAHQEVAGDAKACAFHLRHGRSAA